MSNTERDIRALSTKELMEKIGYYQSFSPRGINYQRQLDLHEAELERRFLAWEVTEV